VGDYWGGFVTCIFSNKNKTQANINMAKEHVIASGCLGVEL